jgi:3-hydroxyacyl-CoA dehydrogenase/enoyl-CoA hydratase/3-hydroxybutyryl-CoA epimerase
VPRLTDAQSALQMLTTGQTLSPQKAKAMNLVHQIAEPGEADRRPPRQMIKGGLKPVQPWDEKGFKAARRPGLFAGRSANLWPPAIAILRRETATATIRPRSRS